MFCATRDVGICENISIKINGEHTASVDAYIQTFDGTKPRSKTHSQFTRSMSYKLLLTAVSMTHHLMSASCMCSREQKITCENVSQESG
jgi:hypothetical protein